MGDADGMTNFSNVRVKSNLPEIKKASKAQIAKGLEMIGLKAEGYAKRNSPVDTGRLRNSITHQINVNAGAVAIGTNVEYAVYVEFGSGPREGGAGKVPFLGPAISEHIDEYENIMKQQLK